jgi:hypothetical protein
MEHSEINEKVITSCWKTNKTGAGRLTLAGSCRISSGSEEAITILADIMTELSGLELLLAFATNLKIVAINDVRSHGIYPVLIQSC